jgi:UDP-N-acetylmuramoyl-tripeptide--D-alanyl-D-alanine ligase
MVDGTLYNSDMATAIFRGVSIDSRTIKQGELFIAIRGDRNDGHEYISQALDRGAAGVLVEFSYPRLEHIPGQTPVIAVQQSHEAMIKLATAYRQTSAARFIGITGSNGKTTTKELTYRLIKALEDHCYRSPGNLNNLYGVPLALLGIPKDCQVAIMELGISTNVEMPRLAEMVRPEIIVITNVGATHLEFLGTVENVAKAKLDLVRESAPEVPLIINADDPILMKEAKKVRSEFTTFALETDADFVPSSIETDTSGGSEVTIENNLFNLPLVGRHQVYNLLAAYAVARTLGYSFYEVDTASLKLTTEPMRGQRVVMNGITFIADCYNANPESMQAGVKSFLSISGENRRWLILGDMLELGKESSSYHQQIGRIAADYDFEKLIAVGEHAADIIHGAKEAGVTKDKLMQFVDAHECVNEIKGLLHEGDIVYLKASRGVGLEAVLNAFRREEND